MEKKMFSKTITIFLILFLLFFVTGCQKSTANNTNQTQGSNSTDSTIDNTIENTADNATAALEVRFGYEGEPFIVHVYDNETASEIVKAVGTRNWNLPIYNFDNFEHADVMQFYDIPESYDIPSNPETVTLEKAGEVYYSDPNRIILFYQDAEVTGKYTRVGYIEYSDDFYEAVINNPVLEGWNTKIVSVRPVEY